MATPAAQRPPPPPLRPPQLPPRVPRRRPAPDPPSDIATFYFILICISIVYIAAVRQRPPRPQLFVSFRGKELRNGFVSHVVKALGDARVNVFIDSYEQKGRDLQTLFKRIDDSKIALVIFSDRFAESEWCLNEVVRMDKRVKNGKLRVIPVFYRVNTTDVKNFSGRFGSGFEETVQRQSPEEKHMAERWMSSVKSVSSKTGFTSEVHSIDSNLVDAIVEDVKSQLPYMFTENKLSIPEELLYALDLAALFKFVAHLFFTDTSFFQTRHWFVGVSCLVLVHRRFPWTSV